MNIITFGFIAKLAISTIVLIVTMVGFRAIKRKLIQIIENTSTVAGYTKRITSLKYSIAVIRVVIIFMYIIFLFIFFDIPGNTIISFLGLVSVAISLLLREVLLDYVFGFLILLEGKVRIDDEVKIEGFTGTVEIIELRTTKIRDGINGDILIISNRHFTKFIKKKSQRGFVIEASIQATNYEQISEQIKKHYVDDQNIKTIDVLITKYNADKMEIQIIVDSEKYTYNHLKQEILKIINEV